MSRPRIQHMPSGVKVSGDGQQVGKDNFAMSGILLADIIRERFGDLKNYGELDIVVSLIEPPVTADN